MEPEPEGQPRGEPVLEYRAPPAMAPQHYALRIATLVFLLPVTAVKGIALCGAAVAGFEVKWSEFPAVLAVGLPLLAAFLADATVAWKLSFGWKRRANWLWQETVTISIMGNLVTACCAGAIAWGGLPRVFAVLVALFPLAYAPCVLATLFAAENDPPISAS